MKTGRYAIGHAGWVGNFYCSEQTAKGKPCPREGYLVFHYANGERSLVCYSHFNLLKKKGLSKQ